MASQSAAAAAGVVAGMALRRVGGLDASSLDVGDVQQRVRNATAEQPLALQFVSAAKAHAEALAAGCALLVPTHAPDSNTAHGQPSGEQAAHGQANPTQKRRRGKR